MKDLEITNLVLTMHKGDKVNIGDFAVLTFVEKSHDSSGIRIGIEARKFISINRLDEQGKPIPRNPVRSDKK